MTAISSEKHWLTAILSTKKMDPSYLEVKKTGHCYFEPEKQFCNCLERDMCGSLLFGDPKRCFTTSWSKEKEDDCYFK